MPVEKEDIIERLQGLQEIIEAMMKEQEDKIDELKKRAIGFNSNQIKWLATKYKK